MVVTALVRFSDAGTGNCPESRFPCEIDNTAFFSGYFSLRYCTGVMPKVFLNSLLKCSAFS